MYLDRGFVVGPTVPCTENRGGTAITCGSPPPIGPSRVGEPRDVLACEVLAVAAAEDAYKVTHGTYFATTGGCASLPGYRRRRLPSAAASLRRARAS